MDRPAGARSEPRELPISRMSSFRNTRIKTWYYRVRAYDAAGNVSGYSGTVNIFMPDVTTPSTPSGLSALRASGNINLSWSASSDNVGVAGYKIERSPNGSTEWTEIGTSASNAFSNPISPRKPEQDLVLSGKSVRRRWKRIGLFERGQRLHAGHKRHPALLPDRRRPGRGYDQPLLEHGGDNVGVAGYKIERSPNGSTEWTQIGTSASSAFSNPISPENQNKTWYYRVRAYDAAGNVSVIRASYRCSCLT